MTDKLPSNLVEVPRPYGGKGPVAKVPRKGYRRCNQCYRVKHLEQGFRQGGKRYKTCNLCRQEARIKKRGKGKPMNYRKGLRESGEIRVTWTRVSNNRKLGHIPTTMTSPETCPKSCAWYNAGCFGEQSFLRHFWRMVENNLTWNEFLKKVRALPAGQVWRHNTVGDLPGHNEYLDVPKLLELSQASQHTRGFTFTHKKLSGYPFETMSLLRKITDMGFTINMSCDSLKEADELLLREDIPPVTVVLPEDEKRSHFRTPGGNMVTVCPHVRVGITCKDCKLCTVPHRKGIVGFPAHGNMKKLISLRLKGD